MTRNENDRQTCVFIKDDGESCKVSNALSDAGLCLWHDPERRDKASEVRSRGGKTTAKRGIRTVGLGDTPGPLETMEDAARWAAWATQSVAVGTLDARTAHEVVLAVREFRNALDKSQLEQRVRDLERALKEAEQRLAEAAP